MEETSLIFRIVLTIVFGAILGLEAQSREIEKEGKREAEKQEPERLGGVRTYTIISIFGGIAGVFYLENLHILMYITFLSTVAFLISAYIMNIHQKHAFGLTTEFAIIITFLIGFFTTSDLIGINVVLTILVLLAFFVSQKQAINSFVGKIKHKEVIDLIKFALVSFVVLPVLPDKNLTVLDIISLANTDLPSQIDESISEFIIINPFKTWLIVTLISGFSLLGYLLGKFIGKKNSIILSGVIGGLISSTATTIALAKQSKPNVAPAVYAGATVISSAISFISVFLIILITNTTLAEKLFPLFGSMLLIGTVVSVAYVFFAKNTEKLESHIKYEPFTIMPAIQFVSMLVGLKILIQLIQLSPIADFFLIFTSLSGFVGLDATAIAISELSLSGGIGQDLAFFGIISASAVNFLAKALYAQSLGAKKYSIYTSIGLALMLLGNLAYFVV